MLTFSSSSLLSSACTSLVGDLPPSFLLPHHLYLYSSHSPHHPSSILSKISSSSIYLRINRLKKTKSTLPLDLLEKLRKECSAHLVAPLTIIMNNCLTQSVYPALWKQEYVTPAPKISHPQDISDLRKISGTLDFSKTFEGFLKDWILQVVCDNIDISQYGGQHRFSGSK